ncbi:hypothetical protein B0T19DRAFT_416701 [Cercophora scortea]|uniref:Ubiquitin-like domain-containing protein n=1 Tax=Cercophora scortea TaxID=314031 RepID=A0AAE0IXR4_9PEZI|nr:hypothetical protein B0T19DRAFT_416701 [Cercophora scortea]
MFLGKPGCELVGDRHFYILCAQTHRVISSNAWSSAVAPGDKLAMSMVLKLQCTKTQCPRCGIPLHDAGAEVNRNGGRTW